MLDVYAEFAEEHIALPVIKGVKTPNERFAGAEDTYCIEALMQDGKALQAGTSHFLGQNFAKAFDVQFTNKEGGLEYVWGTSWGVSTRLMGALIMAHSDGRRPSATPQAGPDSGRHRAYLQNRRAGRAAGAHPAHRAGPGAARHFRSRLTPAIPSGRASSSRSGR